MHPSAPVRSYTGIRFCYYYGRGRFCCRRAGAFGAG